MTAPAGRGRRPGGGRRPSRPQRVFTVVRTVRLSPHLVRVYLGGPDFGPFVHEADPARLASTDKYVKLLIAKPDLGLTPPYDLEALRLERSPDQLPAQRTYTVRSIDHEAETIAIDFVVHGNEGAAGPWALTAQPGDLIALSGPGGGYRPSSEPGTGVLLLGDDSAIPAIGAALEAATQTAVGMAVIEVQDSADEIVLPRPDGIVLRWVHRSRDGAEAAAGTALVRAVEELERPTGPVDVFAHGERAAMKAIRAVLEDEWAVDRRALSLSAYWASGRAEDRFQAEKREPIGQIFIGD